MEDEEDEEEDPALAEMLALTSALGGLMGFSGDEPPSDIELADQRDDLDALLNPSAPPPPPPQRQAAAHPLDGQLGGGLDAIMGRFKAPEIDPFDALGAELDDDEDDDGWDDPYAYALEQMEAAAQAHQGLLTHLEQAQEVIALGRGEGLPEPEPAFDELELLSSALLDELKRALLGEPAAQASPAAPPWSGGGFLMDAPLWPDEEEGEMDGFILPEVELAEEIPDHFILEEIPFEAKAPPPTSAPREALAKPRGVVEILDDAQEEYGSLLHGAYQRTFAKGSENDLHYTAWLEGFGDSPQDVWGNIHVQDLKQSVKQRPFSLEEPAIVIKRSDQDLNISPLKAPSNYRDRPSRVKMNAKVGVEHGNQFFTGFTKNISVGGLFIETYDTPELGEKIDLYFELPDGYTVQVIGEVRWVRAYRDEEDAPPPGIGIRFIDLSSQDRLAIDHYVETHETLFFDEED
ncbi:TIGR02266 family protein [Myxococcota bacterium]|nr:TIGR02266 family protein [Myxococcota bacterium]MBU1900379.1 TIGR02266 family protein [Myxococcota bacterium]